MKSVSFESVAEWMLGLGPNALSYTGAVLVLILGLWTASLIGRRLRVPGFSTKTNVWFRQVVRYLLALLAIGIALSLFGVNLAVLLGAAGVFTVAIGFASQTAASNLISGLFMMGEQPFGVGDVVDIEGTMGEVMSIDPLSVKIRTFDNLLVRVPNETVLKTRVVNLTRFPIRRMDILLRVRLTDDLHRVIELLESVADDNTACLEEPKPFVFVEAFQSDAIELKLTAWTVTEQYYDVKNDLTIQVKNALAEAGFEFPLPQRVVSFASLRSRNGSSIEAASWPVVSKAEDAEEQSGTEHTDPPHPIDPD
ncbi:MAG: mechanosensitive ion channel family protein [Myxococcota bacterium]